MRASGQVTITEAILKGVVDAYREYDRIANDWVDHAPEYFVTTSIARRCAKDAGVFVTLEHGVDDIKKRSRIDRRGRPPSSLGRQSRVDMVIWWKTDDTPRAIVEVKHPIVARQPPGLSTDIERVCTLLNRTNHSLEFGAIAFYVRCQEPSRKYSSSSQRLRNLLREIVEVHREYAQPFGCDLSLQQSPVKRDDFDAWAAACLVVQPMS